jgi:xanthine/uracil permease
VDAAFRALRFDAAAAAGIIAVHLYTPFSEALGLLNVTRSEDV